MHTTDYEAEQQVEGDEEYRERAVVVIMLSGKVDVHEGCHCDGQA